MGVMEEEIAQKQVEIRTRRDKHKPFEQATKMMNVYYRVQAYKNGIHFGLDHQDTLENMDRQVKYFRGLDREAFDMRNDSSDESSRSPIGSRKKKNHKVNFAAQLKNLYR